MTWYCVTHGFQRGPMTLDAMRSLVAKGALLTDDWVWEPGMGADWRKAGNVAELFPARAGVATPPQPQPLPLPLVSEGDAPSVRAALSHALNRMFQILFKPFSTGVWLRLFLFIMMARMNPLTELAGRVFQITRDPGDSAMEPVLLARVLAQRLAAKWDAFAGATFSGQLSDGAVVALVLALTLVVALHVSGWGVFLLLHGWHNPRARFFDAFNGSRAFTREFIRWKFAYTLPLVAVCLGGGFVFFKEAVLPFARGAAPVEVAGPWIWAALLAGCGALMLLSILNFLTDQLAAPLMWLRGVGVRGAFALVWRCVAQHPWVFARLAVAYGVFMTLASLFPALALAQAQPDKANFFALLLITMGFVPFHILMRGFTLCYLAQWRPEPTHRETDGCD